MHSLDLPVKLWLKILGHLPRATLHKMIGINRILFELAMDDLYKEVRFIGDDEKMLRAFEKMRSPVVARRVRRFIIEPAFLPDLDQEPQALEVVEREPPSRQKLLRFLHLKAAPTDVPSNSADDLEATENVLFREVVYAMTLCENLRELEISVHDLSLTVSFINFLDSLWKADSVGPNLRHLSINTTLAKIPSFLQPLIKSSKSLARLEEFSLRVSPSREDTHFLTVESLQVFSLAFGKQLTAIALSSPLLTEITPFLGEPTRPHYFPKLKKLEIFSTFTPNPGPIETLSRCIAVHSHVLEHLTINPRPRHAGHTTPDASYSNWINPTGHNGPTAFAGLDLANLRTLNITLCEISQGHARWPTVDALTSRLLPDLSTFASNITSLVLNDASLSFRRISDLVCGLSRGFGESILETLTVMATTLSPQLFDLLALRLPSLKTLTINYHSLSDSEQTYSMGNSQFTELQFNRFCQTMRTRRYPRWGLQFLRLTTIDPHCGKPHPNPLIMKKVAESLASGVELDCSYVCFCQTAFSAS